MDHQMTIIGIGRTGTDGLSSQTIEKIRQADVLIGSDRLLKLFPDFGGERIPLNHGLTDTIQGIGPRIGKENIVMLSSGDPDFFGLTGTVKTLFPEAALEIIPAVSYMQEAFAKAGLTWEDAALISVHQNLNAAFWGALRRFRKIGLFTGPDTLPQVIAGQLNLNADPFIADDYRVWIFQNTGMENELTYTGTLESCISQKFDGLCTMILMHSGNWQPRPEGYVRADRLYDHRNGLITKADVRALIYERMPIREDSIIWDIGAGSGAVSIEMAERAWKGSVYAVERDDECLKFIHDNARKFNTKNLQIVPGCAPEVLADLPDPDVVFVGGSGGQLIPILDFLSKKSEKNPSLVMTFTIFENCAEAMKWFKMKGFLFDLCQVDISQAAPILDGHRFVPQNPVFILKAELGYERI